MHSTVWTVYKIAVLYIGAVIGAGFASGQEILQFFIVFEKKGLWGVVLAAALFSFLGGLVMLLAVSVRSGNYNDVYRLVMGRIPGRIMDILSLVMLPGGLVVMLAGGSAVFSEHLGLPGWLGILLIVVVTIAVLSRGLKGVVSANAVLVPLKVAVIVLICLFSLIYSGDRTGGGIPCGLSSGSKINWLWSAVLYVSYNMVVPVAVLSSLGGKVTVREGVLGGVAGGMALGFVTGMVFLAGLGFYPEIAGYQVPLLYIAGQLGGVAGGMALGFVTGMVFLAGLGFYPEIAGYQVPLLYIASQLGAVVKLVLGPLIWLAILTTAIADAHGFASRFAYTHTRRYKIIGSALVLLAIPLSTLKFSFLVAMLYPLFGYVGLLLLTALLLALPVKILRRIFYKSV
ncbi:MAG: hypothetical protein M1130_05960 [Actinobacteria bacterium]|nr:hypothetical protein [Actinomycetota bacterium]